VSTLTARHRRDDVETVEEDEERVAADVTAKATVDGDVTTLDIRLRVR
jgi:hypothetical protein